MSRNCATLGGTDASRIGLLSLLIRVQTAAFGQKRSLVVVCEPTGDSEREGLLITVKRYSLASAMCGCIRVHGVRAVNNLNEAAEILSRDHQSENCLCCPEDCSSVDRFIFKKTKLTYVSLCPPRINREKHYS